ncbi:MAG TPA: hypothetical protein VGQ12_07850 [Candidatus Angelobacter sp.]|jgi:hypothetical protein|nr:hypothetical protein [Candidatus Angelobacter sp.]
MKRQTPVTRGVFLFTVLIAFALPCAAGPFGFEAGMTKEQVIAKVGQKAIRHVDGDVMFLSIAPTPHPDFSEYLLMFSPQNGLVKLVAYTDHIKTNKNGDQLMEKYQAVKAAVTAKYGKPQSFNNLVEGSIWTDPQDFTMSLVKSDRTIMSAWESGESAILPDHIKIIALEVQALNSETGQISLGYELEGFSAYVKQKKEKQNSVF